MTEPDWDDHEDDDYPEPEEPDDNERALDDDADMFFDYDPEEPPF